MSKWILSLLSIFFAVTPLAAEAPCPTLASIKERGKLRVGVYSDDPYFSYLDSASGVLEGFDAEMARAIAAEIMGSSDKVEFVYNQSEDRLEALLKGNVDMVIAEVSTTSKRKNLVDFSDVYYVAGQTILVKVDSPFDKLEDMRGQSVGAVLISSHIANTQKALPDSRIIVFPSLRPALDALRSSKIQAFCVDDVILMALRAHPERILLDYRFLGDEIAWDSYGIAVRKGCGELLQSVNEALRKIKTSGQWQQIYDRNIGRYSKLASKAID